MNLSLTGLATDLAEGLRGLLDRQEITERKHAYLRAADACDPDRMVADLAVDVVASYSPGDPDLRGRDEVREWYATRLGAVVASSHHVSKPEFVFDGPDAATVHWYLYSWQRFANHPRTADRHRYARYTDRWERREGRWAQTSLVCRVAGEYCGDTAPRVGEHLGWDPGQG